MIEVYYFHFTTEETEVQSAKTKIMLVGVYHVPDAVLGTYMCQFI